MIKNAMAVPHTRHHVVVLTLEKHKDGSWITRLIETLRQQDADAEVTLVALESILEERSCLVVEGNSNWGVPDSATILVNRVSDAADPILVKACIAVLGLVSSRAGTSNDHTTMIPVVNGAAAYALCTNKWCHHVLFNRAGLATPRTVKFFRPEPATIQKAMDDWEDSTVERFLLKPNAAGFGAGIIECQRGRRVDVLDGEKLLLPQASDGVLLLQEYIESPHVYRVWFLDGRILCGVVRNDPSSGTSATTTLFNGCVASADRTLFDTYNVPEDVRQEIEDQLLPLLPSDAHTGSVEFLYDQGGERRFYFDLNLLSTLPLENADAWSRWASSILAKSTKQNRIVTLA
jgi:hypothetical protein